MLTELEKQLLNDYQQGMPLVSEPYSEIARELNQKGFSVSENDIINSLSSLKERGMVSRVGPVFKPQKVGGSTLAAIAVPDERMEEVAQIVNHFSQVNHNYKREHHLNLWFVVTAGSQEEVEQVLKDIEQQTGLSVMNLPMEQDYHIDLGFPLWC
ncbi:MAG: Lrp/AsnC family transcriptional regulator [gamma proteobacterium symbiont of Lucinoma myriamae]|nr:Lrp/AsnC family transcriptional regulator [gamma proteobacterium symbiont of Lucinoma myriamae]MCU7819495.1 Lrp/AsnC family transcriptional regulator [gamma proteobacterium symbiont of Lucinoma myriamae]MCU7832554.1 Lrp/AsnC family transcriptional regulator [gamma proteobacterium symbiont of Lucinoma myriamae]